jgi:hypothetical protein
VNLVHLTTGPHLLFIALRDGGPPATSLGWTSPIRTRDKDLDKAVAPSPVEIKLTRETQQLVAAAAVDFRDQRFECLSAPAGGRTCTVSSGSPFYEAWA